MALPAWQSNFDTCMHSDALTRKSSYGAILPNKAEETTLSGYTYLGKGLDCFALSCAFLTRNAIPAQS